MMTTIILIIVITAVVLGLYASIVAWVICRAHQMTDNPIIDDRGVSREELQDMLDRYPADARVVIEYCNIRVMTYDKETNTIRID